MGKPLPSVNSHLLFNWDGAFQCEVSAEMFVGSSGKSHLSKALPPSPMIPTLVFLITFFTSECAIHFPLLFVDCPYWFLRLPLQEGRDFCLFAGLSPIFRAVPTTR